MYFSNAFGAGQQPSASPLASPPANTLAALFASHAPQMPQNGQRQMGGMSIPSMAPAPLSGGSGMGRSPGDVSIDAMLGKGGMGGGLLGGGMNNGANSGGNSSFLKRLMDQLGLGDSQATGDPTNLLGDIAPDQPGYGKLY